MQRLAETRSRPRMGKALAILAAALLCTAALGQPNLARAAPHGGGGFHGGGFSGFHRGGFHAGGVSWRWISRWRVSRWFRRAAQWFRRRAWGSLVPRLAQRTLRLVVGRRVRLDLLSVSLRIKLHSGLRLLRLQPALRVPVLVLLLRSGRILSLCNAV